MSSGDVEAKQIVDMLIQCEMLQDVEAELRSGESELGIVWCYTKPEVC